MKSWSKFGDIKHLLKVLLEDVHSAEKLLEQNDSQFARRSYIRSIFAYVEGSVWLFKQLCLYAVRSVDEITVTNSEYSILEEKSYELKRNGEIQERIKFIRLPDNIRFTFKILNKFLLRDVDIKAGTKEWEFFLIALNIRHRITHPKDATEYQVEDKEIELCMNVCTWFNDLVMDSLVVLMEQSKVE